MKFPRTFNTLSNVIVGVAVGFLMLTPCCSAPAATLNFAGRTWTIKSSTEQVGPGPNYFSSKSSDVWVDGDGLHMTVHQHDGHWWCTEVILNQTLGYGTYLFQTSTRQDILNTNVTFGAFTWDPTSTSPIPGDPNREIDFEDGRWQNPNDTTNSQSVVQPATSGHLKRVTIPDLSQDASLTRYFTWQSNRVDFTSARGYYLPSTVPAANIFNQFSYVSNGTTRQVPTPGSAAFRFNLWMVGGNAPVGNQSVEVVIKDFLFIPLLAGDYNRDGVVDASDYDAWRSSFGTQVTRYTGADGDGDGVIGASDYIVWKSNLGNTLGSGSQQPVAVPEPGCFILLAPAVCPWIRLPRRRGVATRCMHPHSR